MLAQAAGQDPPGGAAKEQPAQAGDPFGLAAGTGQSHPMPEARLRAARAQLQGPAVLFHGLLRQALLQRQIPAIHVLVGAVNGQQAGQLGERTGMVLHAQLHQPVLPPAVRGGGPHHYQRSGLLPAQVSAFLLGGQQSGQQPFGQRPVRALKGFGHGRPDRGPSHHVGLYAVGAASACRPKAVPRLRQAARPGVGRRAPARVHHGSLPQLPPLVLRQQRRQDLARGQALPQQCQTPRSERKIGEGLGDHDAHRRLRPGHHGPHGKPMGLHGRAHLPELEVQGRDRVGAAGTAHGVFRRSNSLYRLCVPRFSCPTAMAAT